MIRADNAIHESLKACLSSLNVAEQEAARMGDNIDRLRSINAELVAALERIYAGHEMSGAFTHADVIVRYQQIARAALAKAKEAQS